MLHKASAPPPDAGRGVGDNALTVMPELSATNGLAGEHRLHPLGARQLDRLGFR